MLVSKNPYVVAERVNLAPKKPHFALKTGENFTQNLRLKSLIFIVEKYGMKLLFNFLDKNINTLHIERCCIGAERKQRTKYKCFSDFQPEALRNRTIPLRHKKTYYKAMPMVFD